MSDGATPVYITGMGTFLPGPPVSNDEMEDHLGRIHGKPSKLRERVLKQNGIRSRHYALDKEQRSLYRNSEMAALAVNAALGRAGLRRDDVKLLVAATTQGDLPVPGFASMVHGESGIPSCEIATIHGVCASGMMALKHAWMQIKCGEKANAVACASEFPSRLFKASRYESQDAVKENGRLDFNTEFLRWMLSDGAGAAVLSREPPQSGVGFAVEWIELKSYADRAEVCMFAGATGPIGPNTDARSWLDYRSFSEADAAGAINLQQDVSRLGVMVEWGVELFFDLIERGRVTLDEIDHVACHYSSEIFLQQIAERLAKFGVTIPKERWFSNLHSKGNTGSASMYIMLDEMLTSGRLQPGQKVLCMVPESGRYTAAYMLLTVVGEAADAGAGADEIQLDLSPSAAPSFNAGSSPFVQDLSRKLARVWFDFDAKLARVPIISKLNRGQFTAEDYRMLLRNWRQQVVEGGRWIARAASNVSGSDITLRSLFIKHAGDEHRDFEILEKNYVAVGGTLDEIRGAPKNIGTEALNAWMFHRASRDTPWDLLGAMFIIEGLGVAKASAWGEAIKKQLRLGPEAVTFLTYHGENDANHFEKLEKALELLPLDEALVDAIVKTARVTARLYVLQFEELDQF